jgi:putative flippase GtrA
MRRPPQASLAEVGRIVRFVVVGLFNTLVGYAFILLALFAGLGDYLANALGFLVGLPVAYLLHRTFTFRASEPNHRSEATRYTLAFSSAYAVNIAVVAIGRELGFRESPFVQFLAITVYAALFYVLNRLFVFREVASERSAREN